jgi:hypothetical protein
MKISRKIISLVLVAGLLIAFSSYRLLFAPALNSVEFRVFESTSKGHTMSKVLGVLPKDYRDRFKVTMIEKNGSTNLSYVIDMVDSRHPYYLALTIDKNISFIKGYPYMWNENGEEQIQIKKHPSTMINVKAFNAYLKTRHFNRERTILKFCQFLSRQDSQHSYQILQSKDDAQSIVKDRESMINYLSISPKSYPIITADQINFQNVKDGVIYCWFLNAGVVRLQFEFESRELKSVNSQVIGYLGVEVPLL